MPYEKDDWESAEPGIKRRVFKPGRSLMMMEVHFEEGAQGYAHSHPHEQLTYCLKGSFEFRIDGVKHLLKQGETLVIPSGAVHRTTAIEEGTLLDTFTPLRDDLLKRV
ncbi:Cupin domain protein [Cohnella sp. OV330]|uniref:cupin domain-containing protein n=1 Tax=Cohnella sp. OV330 TaxID=1855288 RepID=UPI0008E5E910|nr:cupin domain-containing protein [Cohnella sp. OV330]SFB07778.1 Cupin domain protein [Cohnella sp. OV330]